MSAVELSDPLRVIVWGPGGLGGVAIYETSRLPEFELVGVRAYSPSKVGRDAGSLLGIEDVGVIATDDVDALLATECDCVLYTPRDFGDDNADDELLRILSSGRNVVTPLPYHNQALYREDGFVERLERACADGRSTFHATGIDPDLISDRVLMALTGLCTDVQNIRLREVWDVDHVDAMLLAIVGCGKPVEEARQNPLAANISTNFLHSIGRTTEHTLGVTFTRVEERHDYVATDHDIELTHMTVPAGTVGRVTHTFEGFTAESGDQPFFAVEYNWVCGPTMLPAGTNPREYWVAELEGTPSFRMVIDLRTSLTDDARFYKIGDTLTEPGYHGTIAPCLQAIPVACAAEPGVLPSLGPPLHWAKDLRTLARRHESTLHPDLRPVTAGHTPLGASPPA